MLQRQTREIFQHVRPRHRARCLFRCCPRQITSRVGHPDRRALSHTRYSFRGGDADETTKDQSDSDSGAADGSPAIAVRLPEARGCCRYRHSTERGTAGSSNAVNINRGPDHLTRGRVSVVFQHSHTPRGDGQVPHIHSGTAGEGGALSGTNGNGG